MMEILADSRKRTVELVRRDGTRVLEKFRAISLVKYMKKFPKSDPKKDGMILKPMNIPGSVDSTRQSETETIPDS